MRHLDANTLAALIGSMAEVIGSMTARRTPPAPAVRPGIAAAVDAFDDGWTFPEPTATSALAARVEQLAAAGMAFIEGDPVTAGQLVAAPVPAVPAGAPAIGDAGGWTLRGRIHDLQTVAAAAEQAAAELTGRQLARRAFPGADRSIQAFRGVAAGHRAAADALGAFLSVSDAADERRRIVEELLDDTTRGVTAAGSPSVLDGAGLHRSRLQDKALSVSDEASASEDRCVAALRAAVPDPADRPAAYEGIERAVEAVGEMLATAAAGEREASSAASSQLDPGDRRSAA